MGVGQQKCLLLWVKAFELTLCLYKIRSIVLKSFMVKFHLDLVIQKIKETGLEVKLSGRQLSC